MLVDVVRRNSFEGGRWLSPWDDEKDLQYDRQWRYFTFLSNDEKMCNEDIVIFQGEVGKNLPLHRLHLPPLPLAQDHPQVFVIVFVGPLPNCPRLKLRLENDLFSASLRFSGSLLRQFQGCYHSLTSSSLSTAGRQCLLDTLTHCVINGECPETQTKSE